MEENKNNGQINIELKEDVAQGIYANLAVISHSSSEFVMDFISVLPGLPKAQVKSRIIMAPEHAKRLCAALQDNIAKYEAQNGKLSGVEGVGNTAMPFNFGGSKTEA